MQHIPRTGWKKLLAAQRMDLFLMHLQRCKDVGMDGVFLKAGIRQGTAAGQGRRHTY